MHVFIQMFRNRISESGSLRNRIKKLESVVRSNLPKREDIIIKDFVNEWNTGGTVKLEPFDFNGIRYYLRVEFNQWPTHGLLVDIEDDVQLNSDRVKFRTEYGDVAVVVDYWLEHELLSRKISILQTKKEQAYNVVDIKLHQLYLMQYWPNVEFPSGTKYEFSGVKSDEFAFYHFVLNYSSSSDFCSSLCSAPFVGAALGVNSTYLRGKLRKWVNERKTNPHLAAPSQTLRMTLLPGSIFKTSNRYKWNLIPKPFSRFLLDAAFLYVGTPNKNVIALTQARIPNILVMKIVGSREKDEKANRFNYIHESRSTWSNKEQ